MGGDAFGAGGVLADQIPNKVVEDKRHNKDNTRRDKPADRRQRECADPDHSECRPDLPPDDEQHEARYGKYE